MKRILPLIILTLTFFCCTQTNSNDNKSLDSLNNNTNGNHAQTRDTSSLIISKTHYILSLKGQKRIIENKGQLSEILKTDYNRQDSLYIFIEETFSDRIEDAMESIHNAKVDKYRIIVRNEFFKLP
jgi:hypothetical protein